MGVPCQDLHVQFCRFRQKVRLQYCVDKFSSDPLNHPLRICQFGCGFSSCPKTELKQCYLLQTQCIWKNTGPSACSHSKCKGKGSIVFFLLKHPVSQLRNMLQYERSTESLQLFGLASFLSMVTLSSLERKAYIPYQVTGEVLRARDLFLSLAILVTQVFTIQEE